jgi:hypothetical protein
MSRVADGLKVVALRGAARLPRPLAAPVLHAVGEEKARTRFARFGLQPVRIETVPVDRLLVQRPVRCEVAPVREATTLEFLDAYFEQPDGPPDWRITNSMQFRLLEAQRRGELPADLSETDYWRWHDRLRGAGIDTEVRSDEWIAGKVRSLLDVHASIATGGYVYAGLMTYVWVLEEPLIATRYGFDYHPDGLEIFDGHHRAAAAAAAELESLDVLVLRDVSERTSFGIPLTEVIRPERDPAGAR